MSKYKFQILEENLVAGDEWSWTEDFTAYGYSPTDYIYSAVFGKQGITPKKFDADNTGKFSIDTKETNGLSGGEFTVFFQMKKGGSLKTLDRVKVTVEKNPSLNQDPRTDNEIILEALIAVSKGVATREQTEIVMPSGKQIKYIPLKELTELITTYEFKVANERNPGAAKKMKMIKLSIK